MRTLVPKQAAASRSNTSTRISSRTGSLGCNSGKLNYDTSRMSQGQQIPSLHGPNRSAESEDPTESARSPFTRWNLTLIPVHSVAAPRLQTKLAINKPGDEYEQEAERVAEQVMRMPMPSGVPQVRKAPNSALQRKCTCGGSCDDCKKSQKDGTGSAEKKVQRKAEGTGGSVLAAAPPIVHEVLRTPGQPLDAATRAFMEPRFGRDFSQVRVHSGALAERSAHEVAARAYTVGRDVVFGKGELAPGTAEGGRLMAHELAHVAQQASGAPERLHRAPPPRYEATQEDVDRVRSKVLALYESLSDEARTNLLRNSTVAVALVTVDVDHQTLVMTTNSNKFRKEIVAAAEKLGIEPLNAQGREEGRGGGAGDGPLKKRKGESAPRGKGAPNDAEQLLIAAAETNRMRVHVVAITRALCPDCGPALEDHGKGKLKVLHVPDPKAPQLRAAERARLAAKKAAEEEAAGKKKGNAAAGAKDKDEKAKDAAKKNKVKDDNADANQSKMVKAKDADADSKAGKAKVPPAKDADTDSKAGKGKTAPTADAGSNAGKGKATTAKDADAGSGGGKGTGAAKATPAKTTPAKTTTTKPAAKPAPKTPPAKAAPAAKGGAKPAPSSGGAVDFGGAQNVNAVTKAMAGANRILDATAGKVTQRLSNDPKFQQIQKDMQPIDQMMDAKSFVENPKGFAANYITDKMYSKVYEYYASSLQEARSVFDGKYPSVETVYHNAFPTSGGLDGYDRQFRDALAKLKQPDDRKKAVMIIEFIPTNENTPQAELDRRKREADSIIASLPGITDQVANFRTAKENYLFALSYASGMMDSLDEQVAADQSGLAAELRKRAAVLEKAGAELDELCDLIYKSAAIAWPPGEAAYFHLQRVAGIFNGLGGDFNDFADVVDGRKDLYERTSKDLQRRHARIEAIEPAFQ